MATVHPSRMALVPSEKATHSGYKRTHSPSPPLPRRNQTYEHDDRTRRRSLSRERGRARERSREREQRDRDRDRRGSPAYDDYRKSDAPPPAPNMYPNRGGNYKGGSGGDFLENRRQQRETMTANPWPPSPKAPARSPSPKRKSHKKSKRARSPSVSDASSSEEERRHRERKDRKRRKEREREREKEERKDRHRRHSHSRHNDEGERRYRKSPSRTRSPVREKSGDSSKQPTVDEDEWVVKESSHSHIHTPALHNPHHVPHLPLNNNDDDEDEGTDDFGPQPANTQTTTKKMDERAYGGSLLRGEGSAMAAFLQEDPDSRIPRRGEIGLSSDQIADYENAGYVMSGNRHRRMNAVRMRKENQVISAEEKRGILNLQREERARREAILREEFTELISDKLKGSEK